MRAQQDLLMNKNTHLDKLLWLIKAGLAALLTITFIPAAAYAAPVPPPTPPGWLPHFESLITLVIVLIATLTAWLLNHERPSMRASGTLLASLSCFGVVVWFGLAFATGVVEAPKDHQTPMDAAKPLLLWTQTIAAFVGGIILLVIANGQRKQTEHLKLGSENEVSRYGRVSRILHWTTAILFISMIPSGIFSSMIPEDVWFRREYNVVHKTIGFIILGLVIVRLIWNFRSKRPALDASLKSRDRTLAHGAHTMLYVLMVAIPLTGYFMTSFHGYDSYFFVLKLAPPVEESDIYIAFGLFHKYVLQYLVYLILGAHVLGVFKHHFVDKHKDAIKRMVG